MHFLANTPEDLRPAAAALAQLLADRPVAAFYGNMGVGKTTFIKVLCRHLNIADTVNSPSFAIINEYQNGEGQQVFHFDLYRLKEPEELLDMGGEDYFYSGHICLVEWPEKAADYLPENRINVSMEELPDGSRSIRFELL
ncbi:ATPase [Geofilum rubicundum JCM 15548]|uniref:tRNA threonylcarbamoyladenosine biosynthesis protein TsaE n=2 Tax=Geofilum TaxID=1236988 RepID=A0A0E9LS59_9BACT|nr:ATPase [Geofilum rubicundum JCM 15548]